MKTLVEKSIEIYGMGHPEVKTVFSLNTIPSLKKNATEDDKEEVKNMELENKEILNDIRFKSLETISGRKLTVFFKYNENNAEVQSEVNISIPFKLTEDKIKKLILNEIKKELN